MTGASSGIGEAFADELAGRGVSLILVGRNADALEAVAARARARGVGVQVIRADLATDVGMTDVDRAIGEAAPAIDLLVNNAALGQWGLFAELGLDRALESIRVNNEALVRLTHAAVTRMLAADRGSIIQMSSMAGASPGPQQAVYAATKAFVTSFGQALSAELAATPVTCTTVLPGFTRTNYFARVGLEPDIPEDRWMTAAEVAQLSLEASERGRQLLIPGPRNRRKILIATQFPTLGVGRAKHHTRQTLGAARSVRQRLDELVRHAPSTSNGTTQR